MKQEFDPSPGKVPGQPQNTKPAQYFLPGQIMLQVQHPADLASQQLVDRITEFIYSDPESPQGKTRAQFSEGPYSNGVQTWRKQIQPPKVEAILMFPRQNDNPTAFSMIPTRLINEAISEKELFSLVTELNNQFQAAPLGISGGISFEAASPNWLLGGAPGQSGTGGPGSWPIPVDRGVGDTWKFQFLNQEFQVAEPPLISGDGDGIHVAILDTMPTPLAMEIAYEELRWSHPLAERLLKKGGPLNYYPASYADLNQLEDYDLRGHRYRMRGHGLFIAGIINTLAPKATLHLYEVLNPYGVGSIETIARGLIRVLENPQIQGCPLIINCSFMLGLPSEKTFDPDFRFVVPDPSSRVKLSLTARKIFDRLAARPNTILVAAAGNDAYDDEKGGHVRPETRFPAAFDPIIGVGALPILGPQAQRKAASYSDLSDDPTPTSYITLGGEPGPEQGVLGLYIGEFPDYAESTGCLAILWQMLNMSKKRQHGYRPGESSIIPDNIKYKPNMTGWAWWAGTSFAAPVISGILAARHSQSDMHGRELNTEARNELNILLRTAGTPGRGSGTPEQENIILVRQG